jgi:hypothetical protein
MIDLKNKKGTPWVEAKLCHHKSALIIGIKSRQAFCSHSFIYFCNNAQIKLCELEGVGLPS